MMGYHAHSQRAGSPALHQPMMSVLHPTTRIYVDADACPVKTIYRVAIRHGPPTGAGNFIRVPSDLLIEGSRPAPMDAATTGLRNVPEG